LFFAKANFQTPKIGDPVVLSKFWKMQKIAVLIGKFLYGDFMAPLWPLKGWVIFYPPSKPVYRHELAQKQNRLYKIKKPKSLIYKETHFFCRHELYIFQKFVSSAFLIKSRSYTPYRHELYIVCLVRVYNFF